MDVQIVLEMMVNDFESNKARTKYCILFHAHVYLQVFSTKKICMLSMLSTIFSTSFLKTEMEARNVL